MDFSITLVVLNLDAEGNGEGQLTLGNEIIFNKETNTVEISNAGTQPIRMTNIRPVN